MFDEATSVSYRMFIECKYGGTGICNIFESIDQDTVFYGAGKCMRGFLALF